MPHINLPHQVASPIGVSDIVARIYKACQEPAVLEAGGDAARAVANAAKHVGRFVHAFRGAWANG